MMRYLMQFISLALPTAIVFSCFQPYRRKSLHAMGLYSSALREVCLILYVMLLSGIIALKLFPVYYDKQPDGVMPWGHILLLVDRASWDYSVNLIPFGSINDFREWIQYGTSNVNYIITNLIGNFLTFVPFGFLTSALFRKATLKRAVFTSAGIAFLTEIGQYFLIRYASVDNAIINILGAVCGYYLFQFTHRNFPRITQHFLCHPNN